MSYSGLSDLFEYLCYGSTAIRNNFYLYSTGIDFSRQNLTSTDVTFCRTFKVRPHRTPRRALKKINCTVFHSRGYTACKLRRAALRREMKAGKSLSFPAQRFSALLCDQSQ